MRRLVFLVALTTFLIGSACSGDDSSDDAATSTEPSSAGELEAAVRAYTAGYLGGAADAAYDLLSERCHEELSKDDFGSLVAAATATYGGEEITGYSADVDGNVALANYQLTDSTLDQVNERWVLEDGDWRNDDC